MKRLTSKQSMVLSYLEEYIEAHGYSPTIGEIAEEFGWSSHNAAFEVVRALEDKGAILRPATKRTPILIVRATHTVSEPDGA